MQETERVIDFYRRPSRWTMDKSWVLLTRQRVERTLAAALRESGTRLEESEILDVGTGSGAYLNVLLGLGATPSRCHGIDLVPERIAEARERCAARDLRVADARELPFAGESFDLVSQFTCFCNLPSEAARAAADEAVRVLRPGGRVLWFDLADCPPGAVTRPILHPEDLFPSLRVLWQRRMLHPWTEWFNGRLVLSEVIERLPVRKTNLLMILAKP